MNARGDVLTFDHSVGSCESGFSLLLIAVFSFFLEIVFFGDDFRRVGSNGCMCMDHVRQHFVVNFDRAQCVACDLRRCGGDCCNRSARKTKFSQRRLDDRFHAGDLRRCIGIDVRDTRVCVRATKNARVKHARQALVVGVTSRAGYFQWPINAGVTMIEEGVLVVRSPARAGICVDFDLDHLLDAVDDARYTDLFLRFRCRCCLWLLHQFSLLSVSRQ